MDALSLGGQLAAAAADEAANQIVRKVVGQVADKTARLAAVHDIVVAAVQGMDSATVRMAATDALMAVAQSHAQSEARPVCESLGISTSHGIEHLQNAISRTIFSDILQQLIPQGVPQIMWFGLPHELNARTSPES